MDWSYIAGYFDGEGHVSCHKTRRGDWTRGLFWYNTHKSSLERMRDFIGCGRIEVRRRRDRQRLDPCVLVINRKAELLRVIDAMLPHLIVKKEAAEELRRFLIEEVDETRMDRFGAVARISTEQLRQWHLGERRSLSKIAEGLGVCTAAVSQAFHRRGIPVQPVSTKGIPKSEAARLHMSEAQRKRRAAASVTPL